MKLERITFGIRGLDEMLSGGLIQGLRRNFDIEFVARSIQTGHRHAGSVECDAVTQPHVIQIVGRAGYGQAQATR